jgi:glucan phosphoethanolaminetransferase (alkaline phosphatase superfamily)
MNSGQIMRRLALDALLWYLPPAAFLVYYTAIFAAPYSSVLPHLLVAALPLGAMWLCRLGLASVFKSPPVAHALSSAIVVVALSVTVLYYTVALVGLTSWHAVVAMSVIPTVPVEALEMLDAGGRLIACALTLLGATGLLALVWLYVRRFDWTFDAAHRLSRFQTLGVAACGAMFLLTGSYNLMAGDWKNAAEPVSLSLFPPERDLEGHTIDPLSAARIEQEDSAARLEYRPSPDATRRNVILIVVDALRPDHMSIFGYVRDTTPRLNARARTNPARAAVAHASCADTICGLLSLASSKYPKDFSFHPFSLHEVLKRNGYSIQLYLAGDHSHFYSLRSFYGPVDEFFDGTQAKGYSLNDDQAVIDRVQRLPAWRGVPSLLQFHVMASHVLRHNPASLGPFQPASRYLLTRSHDFGARTIVDQAAINFYDDGVVATDGVIDQLLVALKDKGYLSNALVVITADHGESLGEHGLYQHANSVREEVLRIPLILLSYGYVPHGRLDPGQFISQVDIAPTILAELGIPAPTPWAGLPAQTAPHNGFAYFEEHGDLGLFAVDNQGRTWKYWLNAETGAQHAFNLATDPQEQADQSRFVPAQRLAQWRLRTLAGTN